VTEKQKRFLKKIGKVAAYTAITGGSYILARGALSLLLKRMEPKNRDNVKTKARHEKAQSDWQSTCQTALHKSGEILSAGLDKLI
jgi:hypothetical protein